MTLAQTIGQNLARIMASRGMNAPELASRVGVTKAAVYRWLEGNGMTIENLEACALALGVQPATLCLGHGRE